MNRIKNSYRNLLGVFAFALLIFGLPTLASAQWGGRDRDRDRDNNYYNAGQLKSTVKRLKSDSRDFVKFVDRDLDRSRYDNRNREDNINQLAKDFRDAASRLESRFGNGRNLRDSEGEARDVLRLGNQLDRAMRRVRLSQNVENYWRNIDRQLEEVSRAYIRRSGWRNGGF
jgi:hypothetical protein